MKSHLELLSERVRASQPIERDIRVLREEIDRVGEIVARIGTTDLAVEQGVIAVDINILVRELMIEVAVSDTGRGMPPEILENLFSHRLRMSKGAERGYGLSNAFTLIKQLGGHVLCRSDADRGTTFAVLLPRALRAAAG